MDKKAINDEISRYWTEGSDDYDSHHAHGLQSEEEKQAWLDFLKKIIPSGSKKILDVGAGTGFLTLLLAELGYEVRSLDLSEGMQDKAKRKAKESGLEDKISFVIGDAEDTKEPSDAYDVVINRHLLWTLPHPYEDMKEWLRVTKPGGAVIVIDGDWANQSTELKKKIEEKKKAEGENGHGGRKYSDELKDVLPLNSGQKRPADFIAMVKDDGYEVDVYDLANVEVVEKKLFREDLYIQSDEYRRDAYFIHKPL